MVKEAEPLVEETYQDPNRPWMRQYRALLMALHGKQQEAEAMVPSILENLERIRGYHHGTYNNARIHALGGKSKEAVKWLRVTVNEGFPCYPLFAHDSFLNPIRKDLAFLQFMSEMKAHWGGIQMRMKCLMLSVNLSRWRKE